MFWPEHLNGHTCCVVALADEVLGTRSVPPVHGDGTVLDHNGAVLDGNGAVLDGHGAEPRKSLFSKPMDVLVINWDAVNGDPEYGSDVTARWFETQRSHMWSWVAHGGLLIIEGQAVHDVPAQRAYDAILGARELIVCGAADELDPKQQRDRCGQTGRVTKAARRPRAIAAGLKRLRSNPPAPTFDSLFPGRVPDPLLGRRDWDLLYRGWFRRVQRRRTKLRWVAIAENYESRRSRRHPICVAARHGKGAIVATTMFLAASHQTELIDALLAVHGRNDVIPVKPSALGAGVRALVSSALTGGVVYGAYVIGGSSAGVRFVGGVVGAVVTFVVLTLIVPGIVARWEGRRRRNR